MVRHIIISDTHAPDIIQEIYEDVKTRILAQHKPDAIVINGDLLGVFSMRSSKVHKNAEITREDKKRYLQLCAPNWYAKYGMPSQLSEEQVLEYVTERYKWCVQTLKNFSGLAQTLFNMGNHESPNHFLVIQELPFLLDVDISFHVSDIELQKIFRSHEHALAMLEITHNFVYIRNKPLIQQNTLFMPIPGESHDAVGTSAAKKYQEPKTEELIKIVREQLADVENFVIYNHTQGAYNKQTGMFEPASPAIKEFMKQLPSHLKNTVWVQSHNHWSYTQFLKKDGFHYILNNAGLHGGIYNILDIDEEVTVYDVHTKTDAVVELDVSEQEIPESDALAIIKRNYKNYMDIYLHRKMSVDKSLHPEKK